MSQTNKKQERQRKTRESDATRKALVSVLKPMNKPMNTNDTGLSCTMSHEYARCVRVKQRDPESPAGVTRTRLWRWCQFESVT